MFIFHLLSSSWSWKFIDSDILRDSVFFPPISSIVIGYLHLQLHLHRTFGYLAFVCNFWQFTITHWAVLLLINVMLFPFQCKTNKQLKHKEKEVCIDLPIPSRHQLERSMLLEMKKGMLGWFVITKSMQRNWMQEWWKVWLQKLST